MDILKSHEIENLCTFSKEQSLHFSKKYVNSLSLNATEEQAINSFDNIKKELAQEIGGNPELNRFFPSKIDYKEQLKKAIYRLSFPVPVYSHEPPVFNLVIFTLCSSFLSQLFFGFIIRISTGESIFGLLVGPFIGIPLGIFLFNWLRQNKKIIPTLRAILGITAVMDIAFSLVYLKGKKGLLKRFLVYLLLQIMLTAVKTKTVLNKEAYQQIVSCNINEWLATTIVGIRVSCLNNNNALNTDKEKIIKIGGLVNNIALADDSTLRENIDVLLQELNEIGFIVPKNQNTRFEWNEELKEKYYTVGKINIGDMVFAQEPPVIVDGIVKEKGKVRKDRD